MPEANLERLAVFQGLGAERLARLESCLEERQLGPNEVIFLRDDPCDGLYLVVQGGVVIRSEIPGQPLERLRDVIPGELFGEMEVMQNARRLASARTISDTVVQRIPQDCLQELLNDPLLESLLRSRVGRRREVSRRSPSTRGEPRIWVDRDVSLILDNGQRLRLRLENLSWSGACFAAVPDAWRVTHPVRFALATGQGSLRTSGVVRWRQGRCAGIAFDGVGPAHRRRVAQALRELAQE
ncbi:MAG TPA: cyclic nucleotide-binding domain-containing protein [Thermoanaerobaculia bacterium]|jgi:CRP-like cAMP-binding protein|nr:cyclic nucleotide-binding domain-containing protein [Thermoanaerobaculia bacterium]